MKRVGDPCRPSANPLLLYPLFLSALSPFRLSSPPHFRPSSTRISVLYNLILQSRAVVKAADFTSRLDAHIYVARAHKDTQKAKVCRLRDLRYSSDGVLFERKISLPYKEAGEKSRGKIAHFLRNVHIERRRDSRAHISNVYKFARNHLTKFSKLVQKMDRSTKCILLFFFITVCKLDKDPPDYTGSLENRSNEAKTSFNRYPRRRTISEVSLAGGIEPRQRISRAFREFSAEHTFQSGVTWGEYGIGRERRRWRSPYITRARLKETVRVGESATGELSGQRSGRKVSYKRVARKWGGGASFRAREPRQCDRVERRNRWPYP